MSETQHVSVLEACLREASKYGTQFRLENVGSCFIHIILKISTPPIGSPCGAMVSSRMTLTDRDTLQEMQAS